MPVKSYKKKWTSSWPLLAHFNFTTDCELKIIHIKTPKMFYSSIWFQAFYWRIFYNKILIYKHSLQFNRTGRTGSQTCQIAVRISAPICNITAGDRLNRWHKIEWIWMDGCITIGSPADKWLYNGYCKININIYIVNRVRILC